MGKIVNLEDGIFERVLERNIYDKMDSTTIGKWNNILLGYNCYTKNMRHWFPFKQWFQVATTNKTSAICEKEDVQNSKRQNLLTPSDNLLNTKFIFTLLGLYVTLQDNAFNKQSA